MITDHINDEQLLAILLDNQSMTDYHMDGLSGELITLYCMEKLGVDTPFEIVYQEVCNLVTAHVTENLVKDGLIEPVFDESGVSYECTIDGKKLTEMYKRLESNND